MTLENLTTYTEVDVDSTITVTSTKCNSVNEESRYYRNYVYKDFTAGYFGDIDNNFEFYFSTSDAQTDIAIITYSNSVGDLQAIWGDPGFTWRLYVDGTTYTVQLRDFVTANNDTFTASKETLYYPNITRVGTTATVYIYDDSGRTNLVDTIIITSTNATMRYLYVHQTSYGPLEDAFYTGYTQNYDLKIETPEASAFGDIVINTETAIGDSDDIYMDTSALGNEEDRLKTMDY